ncbi:phosphotransferase [Glycomyces harbinensis]|uniref:Phosphotransferase enzyme family protein n=1 Tax=Glycomyces harbinensis TaxID=58114 RepID=A0A1G7DP08_9ACTN|nr:phosphotransferase [Glycomyces harbinensis]SDE53227.1 Phosphotransferase enzyme family protein [Glycomyces harbinensis]
MQEEALSGGNMDPVVRIGGTVRRVSGEWTAAVHELLERYAAAEIPETPRPQGIDAEGREVLTFIEGATLEQAAPETRWHPSILADSGALMRRLHDASEPLAAQHRTWRTETHHPAEVVCHNDFAPYNLIVRDGRLVGVIDFDTASPGPRLWDFAYLAYRLVPYAEDAAGFDPARHGSREDRLRLLTEAYGAAFDPAAVRNEMARRLDDLAAFTERRAADTGRRDLPEHAAMYRRDAARRRSADTGLDSGSDTRPDSGPDADRRPDAPPPRG